MPVIQWSPEYSIGINSIDEQHKQLINLINQLNVAMAAGETASVVANTFDGLKAYTQVHFAYEEKLFEQFNYPQTKEHNLEHKQLIARVEQFKEEFEQDPSGASCLELMQFMTRWLTNHIQGSDREYAPYLIKHGVK